MVLAVGLPARAQAPKAPDFKPPPLKPPPLKPPEVKLPEVKPPEVKPPEVKPPEVKLPEGKESKPKGSEDPGAVPAGTALPPQLTGASTSSMAIKELEDEGLPLTIEDIVNSEVITASNRAENALEAPAWTLTFTGEELKVRGYHDLTELLDDLPGMDIIRSWGDPYYRSHWRGYNRYEEGDVLSNTEEPFLLMVDGMVFNHLGLGQAQILAALPLSNVERVEVVYGPASALYGPNASMGVINVITRQQTQQGMDVRAQASVRSPQRTLLGVGKSRRLEEMTKLGDFSALYQGPGFRVSLSGRFDMGMLDPSVGERFEWLKNQYFADETLWGWARRSGLELPKTFRSPSEKQALDARLIVEKRGADGKVMGQTEVAAQMYRMLNGRGLVFPADYIHASAPYVQLEQSFSLRHSWSFSNSFSSTTLLRYRRSNVEGPTALVVTSSWPETLEEREGIFAYLQNTNTSLGISQGFSLLAGYDLLDRGDQLLLDFGARYERRDLWNDYALSGRGYSYFPGDDELSGPPEPVGVADRLELRNPLDVAGMYLSSKYKFWTHHALHLGLRLDFNTYFNTLDPSFRGGYVGHYFDHLTAKLFYGQAIAEPSTKNLVASKFYSSEPPPETDAPEEPRPERSQTLEAGIDYTLDWLVLHGTAYYARYEGSSLGGALKKYEGRTVGADLGATALLPPPAGIRQLRAWAYYSPYLLAQQTDPEGSGLLVETMGLAWHKLQLGATLEVNRSLIVTGLGRCLSERKPVYTNPLRESVPGYCVLDANLLLRDIFVEGLSIALRGSNLLDTQYAHPGLYAASSGNYPGRWEGEKWIGSWESSCPSDTTCNYPFNSQMPQPGRAFTLQLGLEL